MCPKIAIGPIGSARIEATLKSGHDLHITLVDGDLQISHLAGGIIQDDTLADALSKFGQAFVVAANQIRSGNNHSNISPQTGVHYHYIRVEE